MPLEPRPSLGGTHRSTSSVVTNDTDSPSSTPPNRKGGQKHVVHTTKHHARVPSSKSLHKSKEGGSHSDLKKLGNNRNASTTSLSAKKNSSHANLRRNRSTADVPKNRSKSTHGLTKRPTSVHFEIGSQGAGGEAEDGWEEASSSASPALSRSASRPGSGQSSAKPSANNSEPQSPAETTTKPQKESANGRPSADARIITERLLQRTPSYNTTKMSLTTATPISQLHSPGLNSLSNITSSGSKDEIVSRFVNGGSSGTPGEKSHYLHNNVPGPPKAGTEEVKRAKSMGNLTHHDSSNTDNEESESALAPRARKTSTHAYMPPQQSRTQQKLWLQRASSNVEPQAGVLGGTALAGYDGRTPGIRAQLEKTGLEYLVVRRYQDPVGAALKRLPQLPGNEKMRRIPNGRSAAVEDAGNGRYGLSQSLRESRRGKDTPSRISFDGVRTGSQGSMRGDDNDDDDGVGALLRSIWEKNYEMPGSA